MKLKDIKKLVDLLGECDITPYNSGIHLLDKKKIPFAELNFYESRFTLYDDYEKSDRIEKLLKDNGIDVDDKGLQRDIRMQEFLDDKDWEK